MPEDSQSDKKYDLRRMVLRTELPFFEDLSCYFQSFVGRDFHLFSIEGLPLQVANESFKRKKNMNLGIRF